MRNGLVLFSSDRGITPADLARAAEERGFDTFYVPEHTHIPVRRDAAHPGTGDETLPDDRYSRTLDPWVSLATAAQVTTRIRLATAVALPVESDPITLAKTIATLDHLSGGRVDVGAGFGWNTDELEDHHVPPQRRRTVLREYVEAMRALWTQDEASYDGEFVRFGPSWAYPKPVQAHVPLIIGAGGGPKTFGWISRHADGWMTTPQETDISDRIEALRAAWADAGREGSPDIRILIAFRPDPADLIRWAEQGVSELIWGVPDKSEDEVLAHLDRLAGRLGLTPG
ncbi:MAG TPA: LLM class F420-dependent oxidoreductase [Nocardioides sp.]|uniref:LLM class F420-dependent oxidoreductase n=1 Tax=uncultured Nocardioides sp. TaxID=198441 RepID=UPI000EB9A4CA|nr:LLM class F420-dependent oxidoreductase [uncultured Nocardioides sp.]HCB07000.1 LLM class F420-dependent oxidoreductase [Nocardioides sp.]HRD60678.1 LLM class F420-dependent oxidoreductase [Nocardioides sp.]HRI96932.1 LLM class F420-dependent oxidoreductase [Nocardioides sp.]HRK46679.1 LLM class F420-dependent oxidoreductase [Nocardioides sp.]